MSSARTFTIDEANALIPRCEMLMERAQRAAFVLRGYGEPGDVDTPLLCPSRAAGGPI
jgi:hypothetical protein